MVACDTSPDAAPDESRSAAPAGASARAESANGVMATAPVTPPARDTAALRFEVDLALKRVRVIAGDHDTVAVHAVAVGSAEWPTETGTWTISQVVLNPEWIPPDEPWADDRAPRKPGDPDNPLGRAQLVYDLPRTIHGTNDPASIGQAVSHGSIRARNDVVLSLARTVLEYTGIADPEGKLARASANRAVKQVIDLPKVVPIRVY
jgi:hypothetical protein